jgi:phosphoenolpyruvate---glycerone phosphotransferase subunit DhaL
MTMTAEQFKNFLHNVVTMVEEQKDYLCELDRKLGDGDHGVTMSIGWQAVNEKLNGELKNETDCGKIAIMAGRTFLSAVGSSVGPLYATGFMRGAKSFQGKSEVNDQELKDFWVAFVEGIKERGQAEVGDKTMVDTLQPALESLQANFERSSNFIDSFKEAVVDAKDGMESTKDILSKRGRSSRLGERSLGTIDPGAASSFMILETFLATMESFQTA